MSSPYTTLIETLALRPHPEGGHYREVFRSDLQVSAPAGQRSAATSIHYLLCEGAYSAWHRIDADEVWYFHAGTPLALHILSAEGELTTHRLGNAVTHPDVVFQAVVPAGCWFAAELEHPDDYALVSCAVAPGFEFEGFQLAGEVDLEPAIARQGVWLRRLLR